MCVAVHRRGVRLLQSSVAQSQLGPWYFNHGLPKETWVAGMTEMCLLHLHSPGCHLSISSILGKHSCMLIIQFLKNMKWMTRALKRSINCTVRNLSALAHLKLSNFSRNLFYVRIFLFSINEKSLMTIILFYRYTFGIFNISSGTQLLVLDTSRFCVLSRFCHFLRAFVALQNTLR